MVFIGELSPLVVLKIIKPKKLANPKANFSFCPFLKERFLDLLKACGSVLYDSLDESLVFFIAPVVAFFHVEVLQVQRAILSDDVAVA